LEGTFKDHLVPTDLPSAGTPSTRWSCSKPHPPVAFPSQLKTIIFSEADFGSEDMKNVNELKSQKKLTLTIKW